LKINLACSGLAHSIAVHDNLDKDCIIFDVFPRFQIFVSDKFCAAKTGVLFQLGSPQEWLVLRAGVRFDAEFNVFTFAGIVVLVKQEERNSVIKWPFQKTIVFA
jgi:hypothetical protein